MPRRQNQYMPHSPQTKSRQNNNSLPSWLSLCINKILSAAGGATSSRRLQNLKLLRNSFDLLMRQQLSIYEHTTGAWMSRENAAAKKVTSFLESKANKFIDLATQHYTARCQDARSWRISISHWAHSFPTRTAHKIHLKMPANGRLV